MAPELILLEEKRAEKRMTGEELLDEFEFLLDSGTHPLLAAQMLGMKYKSVEKLANRHGRSELIHRVDIGLWDRYEFEQRWSRTA